MIGVIEIVKFFDGIRIENEIGQINWHAFFLRHFERHYVAFNLLQSALAARVRAFDNNAAAQIGSAR